MNTKKESAELSPGAKLENFRRWLGDLEKRAAEYAEKTKSREKAETDTATARQTEKELFLPVYDPGPEVFINSLQDNVQELRERLNALRRQMAEPEAIQLFDGVQDSLNDLDKFFDMSRLSKDFSRVLQEDLDDFDGTIKRISGMISDLEEKYK